ncbi:MAG: glycoside hydrolase family 3 N-terminal domain-containing protein, partial [Nanoarchaeota archaeon]
DIWKCRSFPGNETKIAESAEAYLGGLQSEGVIGTAKHYPGKTLIVKDPHKYVVLAEIGQKDIFPYEFLEEKGNVKAIMVSHIITSGAVDSEGVPSVVSKKVLDGLRANFSGLIISDEIHMLGLQNYYNSLDAMYIAVFKAGNDVILNFDRNPNEIYRMIQVVKAAVQSGEIPEAQIDMSVSRILKAKGFKIWGSI